MIGSSLRWFEDAERGLMLNEVLSQDAWLPWQHSAQAVPNFGYTTSAFWFHGRLDFPRADERPAWLLEVGYPLLDSVQLYFFHNGQLIKQFQAGDQASFDSRAISHRHFVFPIPEGYPSLDLYIRLASSGTVELPLTAWQASAFWEHQQKVLILKGIYYGIFIIMLLYNLFIYLSVREGSYFYYVCYAFFLVLFQLSLDGFAFQLLWPDAPAWHEISFVMFAAVALNFLCLFSNAFLKLPQRHPRLSRLLLGISLLTLLAAFSALFLPYALSIRMVVGLSLPVCVSCFLIGVYMWIEGVKSARYFIIAWTAFLIGVALISLSKLAILPVNFITSNAIQIGAALEVVLFSLALADRINSEKRERLHAKQEAINNLEMFKSLYDNAIEGIFQCTLDGVILSANQSMARFLGFRNSHAFMDSVRGQQSHKFLDPQHFQAFRQVIQEKGQVLNYEVQGVRRDGAMFWCSLSAKMVRHAKTGEGIIEGFVVDITARKKSEEQLNFLARHDPLTGLVNRREFEARLERLLVDAKKTGQVHSLLYMDLDQFKLVNDTCGHIAGDELLRQITFQLQEQLRGADTLARLGGDEFGVLLERCSGEHAVDVAHKLRLTIQDFRFSWEGKTFTLGVSIGLVPVAQESESVKELLSVADAACYAAKEAGRNRVHEYTPGDEDLAAAQSEMQWASRITHALEAQRLRLYRQDIAALNHKEDGEHYEILLRMEEEGQLIIPGAFLPAAERYNLMPALDRWVVSHVFEWLHENPDALASLGLCSINLSGLTLGDEQFGEFLRDQLDAYQIPPSKICFEITETVAVTNLTRTVAFMNSFKSLGCRFSLDDFGSGFSSYGYLKNLPVDFLKIDGTFIKDINHDDIDYAMVESINRIGHVMNKKTIAEFVEDDDILAAVARMGIDYAQGYGIAMPVALTADKDNVLLGASAQAARA